MSSRSTIEAEFVRGTIAKLMPALRPYRMLSGLALTAGLAFAPTTQAQMSLSTAVDLALRSNPRVLSAEDAVTKARAQLAETHDAYVPSINAGAGLGQAYGYLPNPPTLFTVNAGSLVFNISQESYIRSSRAGVNAAQLALENARDDVAQDTALAYLALNHDQERLAVVQQQVDYANRLVSIVQDRLNGGQDTQLDLTQAKLTAAQLRLQILHAQDEAAIDRDHLAHLIGIPPDSLRTEDSFPTAPVALDPTGNSSHGYATAGVASAFAAAAAKQQQAIGDARFRFWPQINLVVQYNRYATFTNSFKTIEAFNNSASGNHITADEAAFGVQINLPFFDKYRSDKARESAADAARAMHDAKNAQLEALDGQSRLRHTLAETQAQAEVATLQQQIAQQQLDILQVQLQSPSPDGPQRTPKDEQTARIGERDKYLAVLDANFQLRQAQIHLLRQMGELESWLKSAATAPVTPGSNNLPTAPRR